MPDKQTAERGRVKTIFECEECGHATRVLVECPFCGPGTSPDDFQHLKAHAEHFAEELHGLRDEIRSIDAAFGAEHFEEERTRADTIRALYARAEAAERTLHDLAERFEEEARKHDGQHGYMHPYLAAGLRQAVQVLREEAAGVRDK